MVGWSETKCPMDAANSIMSPTDTTTAAIMIATSSTMPTAVMMESRENTRSIRMIWKMTAPKVAATTAFAFLGPAFNQMMDLLRAFPDQEEAARDQDEVPSGYFHGRDGEERLLGADDPGERQQQRNAHEHGQEQTDASGPPPGVPRGRRSTRMEMKMMLSMPSTSSSAVRVRNAIQASGWVRSSSMINQLWRLFKVPVGRREGGPAG